MASKNKLRDAIEFREIDFEEARQEGYKAAKTTRMTFENLMKNKNQSARLDRIADDYNKAVDRTVGIVSGRLDKDLRSEVDDNVRKLQDELAAKGAEILLAQYKPQYIEERTRELLIPIKAIARIKWFFKKASYKRILDDKKYFDNKKIINDLKDGKITEDEAAELLSPEKALNLDELIGRTPKTSAKSPEEEGGKKEADKPEDKLKEEIREFLLNVGVDGRSFDEYPADEKELVDKCTDLGLEPVETFKQCLDNLFTDEEIDLMIANDATTKEDLDNLKKRMTYLRDLADKYDAVILQTQLNNMLAALEHSVLNKESEPREEDLDKEAAENVSGPEEDFIKNHFEADKDKETAKNVSGPEADFIKGHFEADKDKEGVPVIINDEANKETPLFTPPVAEKETPGKGNDAKFSSEVPASNPINDVKKNEEETIIKGDSVEKEKRPVYAVKKWDAYTLNINDRPDFSKFSDDQLQIAYKLLEGDFLKFVYQAHNVNEAELLARINFGIAEENKRIASKNKKLPEDKAIPMKEYLANFPDEYVLNSIYTTEYFDKSNAYEFAQGLSSELRHRSRMQFKAWEENLVRKNKYEFATKFLLESNFTEDQIKALGVDGAIRTAEITKQAKNKEEVENKRLRSARFFLKEGLGFSDEQLDNYKKEDIMNIFNGVRQDTERYENIKQNLRENAKNRTNQNVKVKTKQMKDQK